MHLHVVGLLYSLLVAIVDQILVALRDTVVGLVLLVVALLVDLAALEENSLVGPLSCLLRVDVSGL